MTAVWIALGAVAISLMTVFMSLNAAKTAKARKAGDGGHAHAGYTNRTDGDGGGD